MTVKLEIEEEDRQIVLLALAKLSIERPGWLETIGRIALLMDNRYANGKPEMFLHLREIHCQNSQIHPQRRWN